MDPAEIMGKLDGYSFELDRLSKALVEVQRKLEPLEAFYEEFLDDFEVAAWEAHTKDEAKFPSAEMRVRLARKAMPTEIVSQLGAQKAKRVRLEKRIKDVGGLIDSQRSLLSALKSEAEASGSRLREMRSVA